LLKEPQAPGSHSAITTYRPGNHSVRSERGRYIRYSTGEEGLYDHDTDPHEWHNLAANPALANTKRALAQHIPAAAR
jgi:hypothetical protein